eukprot:346604-Amorphochlora_amoeboformis.AAC.1
MSYAAYPCVHLPMLSKRLCLRVSINTHSVFELDFEIPVRKAIMIDISRNRIPGETWKKGRGRSGFGSGVRCDDSRHRSTRILHDLFSSLFFSFNVLALGLSADIMPPLGKRDRQRNGLRKGGQIKRQK